MATGSRRSPRRAATIGLALAIALAGGIGIGIGVVADRGPHAPKAASTSQTTTTATNVSRHSAVAPLTVLSSAPSSGASGVSATAPISVTFSAPLSSGSAHPTLTPVTPGQWRLSGVSAIFTPTVPFLPLSAVQVSVPAGTDGMRSADGGELTSSVEFTFDVADGSVVRLQQLLSLLDYSPLVWTPAAAAIAPNDTAAQRAALYAVPAGTFTWRDRGWPAQLRTRWVPGADTVFTRGLIMEFEADHGLDPNGRIGPQLWAMLLSALAGGTRNHGGYDYALADQHSPERFRVWHNGRIVVDSPANTGIAQSPTPDGTFAVFTRLRSQVMRGTNPGGGHYADLVQYIAYFHGNDAVHYMPRADYGIPQSLGCVELPLADAASAWPYLAYGTLVTVVG